MKNIIISIFSLLSCVAFSQNVQTINMVTQMLQTVVLDDGSTTQFWGYGIIKPNGTYQASIPGPVLNINKGDSVYINMYNDSPEDHTIHLHGLDVDQVNDGVGATSFVIHPQDTVTYAFLATYEGVYLYHCHVLTTLHLTMGMYGMIVVNNYPNSNLIFDNGPSFTNEYRFLTSDMDRTWNDNTLSIPAMFKFKANYFMVNGKSGNQLYNDNQSHVNSYVGDTTVLRLGNMAYSKTRYIFPSEMNAKVYMSDGRILNNSFETDTLIVNSGERFTVVFIPDQDINGDIIVEYYEARNNNLEHTNLIKLNGEATMAEAEVSVFDVYPNPVNNQLQFVTLNLGSFIQVFDLYGKFIESRLVHSVNTTIDVSDYENGIYILKYQDKTLKIVKQ